MDIDIDDFDIDIDDDAMEQRTADFIDNQQTHTPMNDCESGACAI
jgi:hypothetical protein